MRGGMSHDTLSISVLMGNLHRNRNAHQSKTIKGMGWSTKYRFKIIVGDFSSVYRSCQKFLSGLKKTVLFVRETLKVGLCLSVSISRKGNNVRKLSDFLTMFKLGNNKSDEGINIIV
jgi:hypothetical protein